MIESKYLYDFKKNYKKIILSLLFVFLSLISTFNYKYNIASKSYSNSDEIVEDLSDSVYDIVENIDYTEFQNILNDLDNYHIFGDESVKDKLLKVLRGDYFLDYNNILGTFINIFIVDISSLIPIIFTIIAIGILSSMLLNFKNSSKNSGDIIFFICFSIIITIVLVCFQDIFFSVKHTISVIKNLMTIIFPILITLLTSIGSFSSISIYNPLVAILINCVTFLFKNILFPIFVVIFLFNILNNLTENVNLNKFISFFNSIYKWLIGIIFTVFTGFLTIQGISAGKFDSVSIKSTKFAIKSYVPIIGSYISEGMDFVVLGSILVKNSIGLIGVFILFIAILSPIIKLIVAKLAFQLCAGILDLSGSSRISNFINSCAKIIVLPIILILGISLMFVIMICLIMSTANIF